jgi:hypothetical protein
MKGETVELFRDFYLNLPIIQLLLKRHSQRRSKLNFLFRILL